MIFAATSRVFWPLYAPKMRLRPPPQEPLPAVGLSLAPHFEIASAATV